MAILLNDKEIIVGINDGGFAEGGELVSLNDAGRTEYLGVARAQVKRVGEWGDEPCTEHDIEGYLKRECSQCWQSLKEELD